MFELVLDIRQLCSICLSSSPIKEKAIIVLRFADIWRKVTIFLQNHPIMIILYFTLQAFFVLFVSRTNLVKNYIALVLAAFMNAGVFEVNNFLSNNER